MYSSRDEMNFSALFLSYRKVFWAISIKYDTKMQDEKINYSFSFFFKGENSGDWNGFI